MVLISAKNTLRLGVGVLILFCGVGFALLGRHEPTPIQDFSAPFVFGRFSVPPENPLTEEAFELGRHLFYDPILSGANQTKCADCHVQSLAFSDGVARARGLDGQELPFNSMSLANLLWGPQRFFWDGRVTSLESQVLQPLHSQVEMNQPIAEVLRELRASPKYRRMFRRAYGGISEENLAKALATFLRMLISADSKYDRYLAGNARLTEAEELGRKLFMAHPDVKASTRGGNCIDCHSQFVTAGFVDGFDGFSNNGLDTDANLEIGLMGSTNRALDRGKFKVPTLRNIAVTAPYMHDGRFETLEQVLDHYNSGIQQSATLSPLILEADNQNAGPTQSPHGLQLSKVETDTIIAFLHTLTDDKFLTNPRFSNPMEGP